MKDFHTPKEEQAHDRAWTEYASRFVAPTDQEAQSWYTAWFAARDYFTRDRNADKIEASEETISASDLRLREMALAFTVQALPHLGNGTKVVACAEEFLTFLQGSTSKKDAS